MTKKERFLSAVRGGTPDLVPLAPLVHSRFAHKILGRSDWKAVFEVHQQIGSIHFRGPIRVSVKASLPEGWAQEERLLEQRRSRKVREHTITTPKGKLSSRTVEGMIPEDPLTGTRVDHWVKKPEDWKVYQSYWEQWLAHAGEPMVDQAASAWEWMGEEGVASVGIPAAFGLLGDARGMQDLLLDLCDYPELLKDVVGTLTRVVEKEIEAFLVSPSEVAWYDICWATGANMSPTFFQTWVVPEIRRAAELVRGKPNKYIGLYTLGRIRNLLPILVDAQPHFIETFEPNQGDISLREAKQRYGREVCLMGNYDCVTLARGTLEDARRETLRCLDEGMAGGGYVLVTGDEVPADAKMDNLKMMVETAEKHGRY